MRSLWSKVCAFYPTEVKGLCFWKYDLNFHINKVNFILTSNLVGSEACLYLMFLDNGAPVQCKLSEW